MTLRRVALILALAASSVCAGETMRCGKWVVNGEVTLTELVTKCGEPTKKETDTQEVRRRNDNDSGTIVIGTTTTERWTYDRGPRAFRMVVTIVDGKVKSIDRVE